MHRLRLPKQNKLFHYRCTHALDFPKLQHVQISEDSTLYHAAVDTQHANALLRQLAEMPFSRQGPYRNFRLNLANSDRPHLHGNDSRVCLAPPGSLNRIHILTLGNVTGQQMNCAWVYNLSTWLEGLSAATSALEVVCCNAGLDELQGPALHAVQYLPATEHTLVVNALLQVEDGEGGISLDEHSPLMQQLAATCLPWQGLDCSCHARV